MDTTRALIVTVTLIGLAACASPAPLPRAPAAPDVAPAPTAEKLAPRVAVTPPLPAVENPAPQLPNPAMAVGAKKAAPHASPARAHSISPQEFIDRNDENLLYVFVDMPRASVHAIMAGYRSGAWVNPCRVETRHAADGTRFEVEFFLTRQPNQYRPLGESVMIPVIFQDNRVHAIGRYGLKKLRAQTRTLAQTGSGCRAG